VCDVLAWSAERKSVFVARSGHNRMMDLRDIHHDTDSLVLGSRIGIVQGLPHLSEQRIGFARPAAVAPGTSGQIQRSRQVVLRMGPWCHDLHWGTLRPPGVADLRQQVESACIPTHHRHVPPQLLIDEADAG
jgi:hypothetical protein